MKYLAYITIIIITLVLGYFGYNEHKRFIDTQKQVYQLQQVLSAKDSVIQDLWVKLKTAKRDTVIYKRIIKKVILHDTVYVREKDYYQTVFPVYTSDLTARITAYGYLPVDSIRLVYQLNKGILMPSRFNPVNLNITNQRIVRKSHFGMGLWTGIAASSLTYGLTTKKYREVGIGLGSMATIYFISKIF